MISWQYTTAYIYFAYTCDPDSTQAGWSSPALRNNTQRQKGMKLVCLVKLNLNSFSGTYKKR